LAHWRNKGYKVLDRLSIVKDGNRQNVFWQKRFYDHNCRTAKTVIEKIKYCHKNPVVRNLVTSSDQWLIALNCDMEKPTASGWATLAIEINNSIARSD